MGSTVQTKSNGLEKSDKIEAKKDARISANNLEENISEFESLCQICFGQNSNIILIPCYHSGLCEECCSSVLLKDETPLCPFCRKVNKKIVNNFCLEN
jgi:hypothetical protein